MARKVEKVGLESLERHTVIVHTKQDTAFRGVLVNVYADCLVLDLPVFIEEEEGVEDKPLGGSAVFPLPNVAYLQVER